MKMNLPNKLTVLRIIMTPLFMAAMLINFPHHYLVALVLFAAASFTDFLDGNIARDFPIPAQTVIGGDGISPSIAAASILAKTYRDDFMKKIHEEFPQYDWNKNMGYPTKAHRNAIKRFGTTPYHRMTFRLLDDQLSLF